MTLLNRSRLFLIVAAALVWVQPHAAAAQDDAGEGQILRSYYSANGFLNRGMYDLAAQEYAQFLEAHADHDKAPIARYGLGVSLYRLERHDDALRALAPLGDPPQGAYAAETLMIRGRSELALDRQDDAATTFGRLAEQFAKHDLADDALVLRAEALYAAGEYDGAQQSAAQLLRDHADSPHRERADLLRALSMIGRDRADEAATVLTSMAEAYPRGALRQQTMLLLAQTQHRGGDASAAAAYQAVIDVPAGESDAGFRAEALYGLAALQQEAGRAGEALQALDQLLAGNPPADISDRARLLRGRVHFERSDYDKAAQDLTAVAGNEALADDAAYWLAKSALRQEDPKAAALLLDRAIKAYPESELRAEMLYDHAVSLLRAGQPKPALTAFARMRSEFSKHRLAADALQVMASIEHEQGNYAASSTLCREFINTYREHRLFSAVWFLIAENAYLSGEYAPAAEAYSGFLERFPEDEQAANAGYRLGMALYQLDRFDEARPRLEQAAKQASAKPAFRPALLALGDGAFQRGDWESAKRHLREYYDADPSLDARDDALLKLALAHQRTGESEKALGLYDELLREFAASERRVQAMFERGQVLISLDKPAEAAKAFEQVLQATDDNGRFLAYAENHLGALYAQQNEHEKAAGYFAGAASHANGDATLAASARLRQGQALMSAGKYAHAAAALEFVLREHGDSELAATAAARRAIALARAEQNDKAIAAIEQVREQYFDRLDDSLAAAVVYEHAWCLRRTKRAKDAAGVYQRLISAYEESDLRPHAMLELAELRMENDAHHDAADLLEAMLRELPADHEAAAALREQATYRLGVAEYRRARYDRAAEILEPFAETYPESADRASAQLLAGEALYQLGAYEGSLKQLAGVPRDHEQYATALLRIGESEAALQHWKKSAAAFEQFLSSFPGHESWYQARFGLGWSKENQTQYEAAIKEYEQVIARHKGSTAARAQFQIGECLFALDRHADAARELLKVDILYAYPEWSAAAIYEAGRCFEAMKDPTEAKRLYTQVLREHAASKWASLAGERLAALKDVSLPGR